MPKLAAAPQADYEVVQPRPPDYGYTDSLPPGSGCLDSPRIHTPEESPPAEIDISRDPDMLQISVTATEIAGGSPPADIDIHVVPDMLQTEISVTTTEMAGGSPPADIDICVIPDVLPIAMSVKTVMSDMSMEMDTPDVRTCYREWYP